MTGSRHSPASVFGFCPGDALCTSSVAFRNQHDESSLCKPKFLGQLCGGRGTNAIVLLEECNTSSARWTLGCLSEMEEGPCGCVS